MERKNEQCNTRKGYLFIIVGDPCSQTACSNLNGMRKTAIKNPLKPYDLIKHLETLKKL